MLILGLVLVRSALAWQAHLLSPHRKLLSSTEDALHSAEWLEIRYEGEGKSMKAGLRAARLGNSVLSNEKTQSQF